MSKVDAPKFTVGQKVMVFGTISRLDPDDSELPYQVDLGGINSWFEPQEIVEIMSPSVADQPPVAEAVVGHSLREEAAMRMMTTLAGLPDSDSYWSKTYQENDLDCHDFVANTAVRYADALVARLKEEPKC